MKKLLLKVRMIKNKRNGQINLSLPKKQFDKSIKSKLATAKKAWIKLEGFE